MKEEKNVTPLYVAPQMRCIELRARRRLCYTSISAGNENARISSGQGWFDGNEDLNVEDANIWF